MIDALMNHLADLVGAAFPFDCMKHAFMRRAMLGLLLLAPLTAGTGIQVVNSRMAFFSDAIGHSAFAGVAMGILLAISPDLSMMITALVVGFVIMFMKRGSRLSTDTVIGVTFSGVVAFGLAVISRERDAARAAQTFLFGDILTVTGTELFEILILLLVFLIFQYTAYNRMLCIAVNPLLASVHRIRTGVYQYLFAALLSLTVMLSVKTSGVLLVTALLVVPAATARNFARNASEMFWFTLALSLVSSAAGLLLSAQDFLAVPAGAAIVLCSCLLFAVSAVFAGLSPSKKSDTEK